MWLAPTFIATFGDAFIEKSVLEGNSNLAWSYSVINFALQRMLKCPLIMKDGSGLDYNARVGLSDSLHIIQQSSPVFKLMVSQHELMRLYDDDDAADVMHFLKLSCTYTINLSINFLSYIYICPSIHSTIYLSIHLIVILYSYTLHLLI